MTGGSILITRAPKSLSTVAAAGPAMKLAQSMTSRSSNRPFGIPHLPWIGISNLLSPAHGPMQRPTPRKATRKFPRTCPHAAAPFHLGRGRGLPEALEDGGDPDRLERATRAHRPARHGLALPGDHRPR